MLCPPNPVRSNSQRHSFRYQRVTAAHNRPAWPSLPDEASPFSGTGLLAAAPAPIDRPKTQAASSTWLKHRLAAKFPVGRATASVRIDRDSPEWPLAADR